MYQETPYKNDYAGTIIDLIARPADARAAAIRAAGQASAHAAEVGGNAYANMGQQIGQDVQQGIGNYQAQQAAVPGRILQAQQIQENQGKIAQQQRAVAGGQALAQAIAENRKADGSIDHQAVANSPRLAQFPEQAQDYLEMATKNEEMRSKLDAAAESKHNEQLDYVGSIMANATTPDKLNSAVGIISSNVGKAIDPQLATQIATDAHAALTSGDPDAIKAVSEKYRLLSPSERKADQAVSLKLREPMKVGDNEKVVDLSTGNTLATGASKPKTEAQIALDAAGGDPNKAMELLKPKPSDTATQQSDRYIKILTDKQLGNTVSPEDSAWAKSYVQQKTIGPEAAAAAASLRQAQTQAEQNAIQKKSQDFQMAQAGRKELTEKVEQPFQTALSSAQTMKDTIAAAKGGNMTAAALQSLETTMAAIRAQGLNRINTAEIGVSANAGSLWDRIQGAAGKLVAGKPVDPAIQKDMEQFAGILERAAYKKYSDAFDATTKRYALSDEQKIAPPGAPALGTEGTVNGKPAVWSYINGTYGWAPK